MRQADSTPPKSQLTYDSFVLRIWRETDGGVWRATVHDSRSPGQERFASPAALTDYLTQRIHYTAQGSDDPAP